MTNAQVKGITDVQVEAVEQTFARWGRHNCATRPMIRAALAAAQAEGPSEEDRMREALNELLALGEEGMQPDYKEWLTFHDKVAQVAKRGLGR